uniref:SH3 domain-containing protein n=1 Tax=Falsiroseomonas oryzae TaxID=2766473 RepID=UPI0022EB7E6F
LPRAPDDTAPRAAILPPTPAMPALPAQTALPQAVAPQIMAPVTAAQGTVQSSARSPINLRSAPGGDVLRTVPRGSTLQVFGEAPGGWLQVGEGEPWGWVHSSGLER